MHERLEAGPNLTGVDMLLSTARSNKVRPRLDLVPGCPIKSNTM